MLTKTKIVLATALFAATSSAALAQGFDPNMANRYPSYATPQTYGYVDGSNAPTSMHASAPHASLHSAPVRLQQGRNVSLTNDQSGVATGRSEFNIDRSDRASSPYAGGGF